jgi:hypothetical protein
MDALTKVTAMALDRIYAAFEKPSPAVADCDVCGERPHDRTSHAAGGIETLVCEECDEEEHARMLGRKVVKFRTRDYRDAYEAGVRARGEI